MTQLEQLISAVKEENLSKEQLEDYFKEMTDLKVGILMERSKLEKEEALFMAGKTTEESVSEKKVAWKSTESGQRLIELKLYTTVTANLLSSLKTRIFTFL